MSHEASPRSETRGLSLGKRIKAPLPMGSHYLHLQCQKDSTPHIFLYSQHLSTADRKPSLQGLQLVENSANLPDVTSPKCQSSPNKNTVNKIKAPQNKYTPKDMDTFDEKCLLMIY